MSRDQMRNLETFKIGSSQVNEFEYQKNQGQLTEQLGQHPDEAATGSKRPTQAERVAQVIAAAHRKVEKKRKKEAAKKGASKQASVAKRASKSAARAKVKRRAGSKEAGKKTASKKSAARKK